MGDCRSLLRFCGRLCTSGLKGRELGFVTSGFISGVLSPDLPGIPDL